MSDPVVRAIRRLQAWPGLPAAVGLGGVLFLVSQLNIARVLGPTAHELLALQTAWSPARLEQVLGRWTADDRANFAAHLPWDTAHPVIYGTALLLGLALFTRGSGASDAQLRWIALAPVAGLCDLVENQCHAPLVASFPDHAPWMFWLGFVMATVKWLISGCAVVALAVTGVSAFRRARA